MPATLGSQIHSRRKHVVEVARLVAVALRPAVEVHPAEEQRAAGRRVVEREEAARPAVVSAGLPIQAREHPVGAAAEIPFPATIRIPIRIRIRPAGVLTTRVTILATRIQIWTTPSRDRIRRSPIYS